jgi:hypothetical protein
MGEIIEVSCRNCSYKKSFSLGVGMAYRELKDVIGEIPFQDGTVIQDILRNHKVIEADYLHRLYLCLKCHDLYERFYVRIDYQTNENESNVHETQFKCPKCRCDLIPIEEVKKEEDEDEPETLLVESLICPKCDKKELEMKTIGNWD